MNISVCLSEKSLNDAVNEIKRYRINLQKKCELFVEKLLKVGIHVGKTNVGNFGKYIVFGMKIDSSKNDCKGILLASENGKIKSKWRVKDGIKEVDVSPLLMAEFGSGWRAENPMKVDGVGQGTFPGQQHAMDKEGWYWIDLNGNLHHSYGVSPTMPVYKAAIKMEDKLLDIAKEVFGND